MTTSNNPRDEWMKSLGFIKSTYKEEYDEGYWYSDTLMLNNDQADFFFRQMLRTRRSEEHYWIDLYSDQINALDGFEDAPEKYRLRVLRKQHQERVAALSEKGNSHD